MIKNNKDISGSNSEVPRKTTEDREEVDRLLANEWPQEELDHDQRVRDRANKPLKVNEGASEIRKKLFTEPYKGYSSFHVAMDSSEEALDGFFSKLNELRTQKSTEEIHEMLLIAAETDYQVAYYISAQSRTGETIADLKKKDRKGFESFREAMQDFEAFGDFIRNWYFKQIKNNFIKNNQQELLKALLVEASQATTENAEFFLGKRPISKDQPEYDLRTEVGDEIYEAVIAMAKNKAE